MARGRTSYAYGLLVAGRGGGGYSGGMQAQPAWPRPAAGVTQAELLDKLGLVQSPAAGGTGFVEV